MLIPLKPNQMAGGAFTTLFSGQRLWPVTDLRQRGGEVVAVFVHQVVGAASKLFAQLLHDLIDVLLREVCGAQHDGLPVWRVQKRWVGGLGAVYLPAPTRLT